MNQVWKYEAKRTRTTLIVSMTTQADVKPYEFIEMAFVARNPRNGDRIVWTLRQRFAYGTVRDWTKQANGSLYRSAVTQLTPAAAGGSR